MADAAFARVLAIAASTGLPGIEAGRSYGTPSLNVRGKFMARIKDADTLVVRCPVEEKHFLMEADPAVFFETDHYKGYPAFLVRLGASLFRSRLCARWPRGGRPRHSNPAQHIQPGGSHCTFLCCRPEHRGPVDLPRRKESSKVEIFHGTA